MKTRWKTICISIAFLSIYWGTLYYAGILMDREKQKNILYLKMLGDIHRQTLYDLFESISKGDGAEKCQLTNCRNFLHAALHADAGIIELVFGMEKLSEEEVKSECEHEQLIRSLQQELREEWD